MTIPDEKPDQPRPWRSLEIGTDLNVVKVEARGEIVVRYPGVVITAGQPASWVAVRARWVTKVVELDGLRFVPGDRLHEFFSPTEWFNSFTVFAPDGTLRGWYANVTHPTTVDESTSPPTLFWHDLYVDLILLPDGTIVIRDEDELEESLLAGSDPALHARIMAARDELMDRAQRRAFPFHETDMVVETYE